MKKVLALALALVMALSMSSMAFAAEAGDIVGTGVVKECIVCGAMFTSDAAYNDHIEICKAPEEPVTGIDALLADLDIKAILEMIVELAKGSMGQWDAVESVIIRIVDLIENLGAAVTAADVEGAVADLEAALADAEIPGIDGILDTLKAKIKALYAGETATVPETTAEAIVETGSSSVGIAVFAAVSVAAAAAYVCTKKKN